MAIEPLATEQVSAHWDAELRVARVVYRGILSPAVTMAFYDWMLGNAAEILDKGVVVRGGVYDFREVTDFQSTNMSTTVRASQNANRQYDFSKIPSAFIVANDYQDRTLRIYLKITPQEHRKRIVKSEAEALQFLDEWNATQGQSSNPGEEN